MSLTEEISLYEKVNYGFIQRIYGKIYSLLPCKLGFHYYTKYNPFDDYFLCVKCHKIAESDPDFHYMIRKNG